MSTDQILLLMVGATTMIVTILKTWQTGRVVDATAKKVDATADTIEKIHVLTNSGSDKLKELNKVLADKLEAKGANELATAQAALGLATARIIHLEQEIVKRADASIPNRQQDRQEPRRETERPPFTGPDVRQQLNTIEQGVETIEAAVVPPKAS